MHKKQRIAEAGIMLVEENLGAVECFEIPDLWVADAPMKVADRITRVFHPSGNHSVLFCHHYRAQPISRPASEAFQSVLYAQFHDFDQNEIAMLSEVLEGLSNSQAFRVAQAGTGYLNDRRIIRVRGDWLERNQSVMSCFIDNGGKGTHVQNLYFATPLGGLDEMAEMADRIFLSVKWKLPQV